MAKTSNQYQPDYTVPTGWVIEERLAAQSLSHAELARRCGRSPKLISEIIAGKAPVEPKTALQLERVLGIDASVLLGIESHYQLHQARESESKDAGALDAWVKPFPVQELVKRGVFEKPKSPSATASALLSFFGVGSIDAWQAKYGAANVAYRHSPTFESDEFALATWLRLAEAKAASQTVADYSDSEFKQALRKVRELTCDPIESSLPKAVSLFNGAGVALALVKALRKVRLSGAAWWLAPGKPLVALSARHKTDDHLWFSLFHEAAHILLHSKKSVFLDGTNGEVDDVETQANQWASDFLVPKAAWGHFTRIGDYSEGNIRMFAEDQGIAPGILVGRLQHEERLPWSKLNGLKVKLQSADE